MSHTAYGMTLHCISFLSPKVVMHFKCACKMLMRMYYCLTYDFNYDYYFNDDFVKM